MNHSKKSFYTEQPVFYDFSLCTGFCSGCDFNLIFLSDIFNVTLRLIGQIAHLLSPFITGAFIAFVLYPLVLCFTGMSLPNVFKMAVRLQKCFLY